MNAVVQSPSALPAAMDSASLLQVIERVALNPDIDIAKMQALLDMHRQISAQRAEAAYWAAMNACQAEMRPIATNAENDQTHSKYADYTQLDNALRPIYTKHGFALSFDEGDCPKPDHIRVLCFVSHAGGFTKPYRRDMPADGKGAKGGDVMTKTHASGSAQTYGMRYLLKGIFNIAVGQGDNDGNGGIERITEKQVADLKALATEVGADLSLFLKFMKVKELAEIPAKKYDLAVKALRAKGRASK